MTRRFISLAPRLLVAAGCVTKPFSPRELLARLHAVLRRYQVQATLPERDHTRRAYRFAGWELNLRTRRLLSPEGHSVELSNGEFSLLNALCRAPQRVLTRDQLLSMSRLHEAEVYDRTIDVQIRRLRLKLETDSARPALILTERGAGYSWPAASRRCSEGPCGVAGATQPTKLARAHQDNL